MLSRLLGLDFDLDATGFEVGEIDVLIEGASPATQGDSDPADDLPERISIAVAELRLGCQSGARRVKARRTRVR